MYHLVYWPREHKRHTKTISSGDILAMLDANNPQHARAAARIKQIEKHGTRYSGEDFDVLSYAFDLTRT